MEWNRNAFISARYQCMMETWNADRNVGLTLTSFSPGSEKKVWWRCSQGHEWKAGIADRVRGADCPYCANRRVLAGYNDLATTNPKLARQWNTQKNQNLTPQMVTAGTHKSVWWRCHRGHEWAAPVVDRNRGNDCPYCSNRKILIGYNDLVTTDPVLAKQWHPFRNEGLEAIDVSRGSYKKVWWQCEKGHQWQAVVKSRATGIGCPYCANQKFLTGYNDLCTTHPDLAEQWHPTKNGVLLPDMVSAGCNRKAWWRCDRGHEWEAVINSRAQGTGCPSCARKRVETGENDLQTLAPSFLLQWHPTKNGVLTPDNLAVGSRKKIWWQCEKGHEWQARARDRIQGQNCPVCSNKQVLHGHNDLQSRFTIFY